MNVVGIERADWHDDHVHTIDVWYSRRRRCWIVERLNVHGSLVGTAHCCTAQDDVEDCLAEWLRSHDEAHMTSPLARTGESEAIARTGQVPRATRRAA